MKGLSTQSGYHPTSTPKSAPAPRASEAEHGTRSRYVAGCRCDGCKAANAQRERERRHEHVVDDAMRALARNRHRLTAEHSPQLQELADYALGGDDAAA